MTEKTTAHEALQTALAKAVKACEIVTSATTARTRAQRILALLDKHGALACYSRELASLAERSSRLDPSLGGFAADMEAEARHYDRQTERAREAHRGVGDLAKSLGR
jgi:hypothetical protein